MIKKDMLAVVVRESEVMLRSENQLTSQFSAIVNVQVLKLTRVLEQGGLPAFLQPPPRAQHPSANLLCRHRGHFGRDHSPGRCFPF